jgi:eukaryotic-like serine/threonine-protein kinase
LLGKYRVESIIGEGGMGGVLKAWHIDLDEPVAIKVLLPEMMEREEIVQRFMREAKAAVKLKGEHVARVLDVGKLEGDVDGRLEGTPYIVMEFLDGADLNAIIKHHGPQEPAMAVDLMLQACQAIAEAHSLGIIHRDIKASNFFVTQPEGQAPHLKVLDFGIATTPKGTSDLTDGSSVIGTPSYMAPEQMRSSRLADARSDIWSLGVVLYEMLEGERPFRSEAYSDLCLKVGMDPPEPMVQPNVPDAMRAIVMKCLEKPVERRYQSAAELAFDLLPFASDPVLARASVEQTARLLSRRGTRTFDASRAPDDLTPAPGAVPRLTPPSFAVPDQSRPLSSLTPAGGVQIQRTPTSVNAGAGQLSTSRSQVTRPPPRRSFVVVGSALAVLLVAGIGILVFGGSSEKRSAAGARGEAAEQIEEVELQPVKRTPVRGDDAPDGQGDGSGDTGSAGSAAVAAGSGAAAGSAARPDPVKTTNTAKTTPTKKWPQAVKKKNDDVYNQRR